MKMVLSLESLEPWKERIRRGDHALLVRLKSWAGIALRGDAHQ